MKLALLSSLAITSAVTLASPFSAASTFITSSIYDGPTSSQYTSSSYMIDDSKVLNINSSAFGQMWYFDVVSSQNPDHALLVAFLASATEGYTPGPAGSSSILSVQVAVRAGDNIYAAASLAEYAELHTTGIGTSGVWNGTGCSFSASQDLSSMTINLSPPFGITGSIFLKSIAPPRLPCSLNEIGHNMQFAPGFGWSNAVPDAKTTVDLKINDTTVQFEGDGYHDLNWGDVVFSESLPNYLWARTRLGPYSVVLLAGVDSNDQQRATGFVSRNGKVLTTSCSGVDVRVGFAKANSTTGPVKDITIIIPIEKSLFTIYILVSDILVDADPRFHGTGFAYGGIKGEEGRDQGSYSGTASFEYAQPVDSIHT